MDWKEFLRASATDIRVAPLHVSVYMALAFLHDRQGVGDVVVIFSREVMPLAKLSSSATYHKAIRDLHAFGYIRYEPSFDPKKGSRVRMGCDRT